jgi:hypothetical protein
MRRRKRCRFTNSSLQPHKYFSRLLDGAPATELEHAVPIARASEGMRLAFQSSTGVSNRKSAAHRRHSSSVRLDHNENGHRRGFVALYALNGAARRGETVTQPVASSLQELRQPRCQHGPPGADRSARCANEIGATRRKRLSSPSQGIRFP